MESESEEQKRRRILYVLFDAQSRLARLASDVLEGTVTDTDYFLTDGRIRIEWSPLVSPPQSEEAKADGSV